MKASITKPGGMFCISIAFLFLSFSLLCTGCICYNTRTGQWTLFQDEFEPPDCCSGGIPSCIEETRCYWRCFAYGHVGGGDGGVNPTPQQVECGMRAIEDYPGDSALAMQAYLECTDSASVNQSDEIPTAIRCSLIPGFSCNFSPGDTSFCRQLLTDGSFEVGLYQPGTSAFVAPDTSGYWQGDLAEIVTEDNPEAASQGLRPCDGNRMLRMAGTDPEGAGGLLESSADVYQLVDLRPYHDEIAGGGLHIVGRMLADRIQYDAQTDSRFGMTLLAMQGNLKDAPNNIFGGWIASETRFLNTDNVRGWQEILVEFSLPSATDYLAVVIWTMENVVNDAQLPEFDGHFIDDVIIQLSRTCTGSVAYSYLDETFDETDWSAEIIYDYEGAVSTSFQASQDNAIGYPTPCRLVDQMYTTDGTSIQGIMVANWINQIYDPESTLIQSISLEFDVSTPGSALLPLIKQDDNFYIVFLPGDERIVTTGIGEWEPFPGACLRQSDFVLWVGNGPPNPDLTRPMQFGYCTSNSSQANGPPGGTVTRAIYVDNFQVTVNEVTFNTP